MVRGYPHLAGIRDRVGSTYTVLVNLNVMNIVAISGSLRKDSFNTALLRNLEALAPEGMTIEIADIRDIPLFDQDAEAAFPASAQALKDKVAAADGVIFATPEYNRSIPGVLKNAIDWVSRPYGQNSFKGKAALTMGVSVGGLGTAVAQSHLRQVLTYLDMRVIGQPEIYLGPAQNIFDAEGNIVDEPTKELLKKALTVLSERVG